MLRSREWPTDSVEMIELARMIAPLPISVMTDMHGAVEIKTQALRLYDLLGENVMIKVPVVDYKGMPMLDVIHALAQAGLQVNATACLSVLQAVLASEAGAAVVSVLAGRVADEGGDAATVIQRTHKILAGQEYRAELLVGSVRTVGDAQNYMLAGPDIVTLTPAVLNKLVEHKNSRHSAAELWGL